MRWNFLLVVHLYYLYYCIRPLIVFLAICDTEKAFAYSVLKKYVGVLIIF